MLASRRVTVSRRAASRWWYSASKSLRSASTRCATACSTASSSDCTGCNQYSQLLLIRIKTDSYLLVSNVTGLCTFDKSCMQSDHKVFAFAARPSVVHYATGLCKQPTVWLCLAKVVAALQAGITYTSATDWDMALETIQSKAISCLSI